MITSLLLFLHSPLLSNIWHDTSHFPRFQETWWSLLCHNISCLKSEVLCMQCECDDVTTPWSQVSLFLPHCNLHSGEGLMVLCLQCKAGSCHMTLPVECEVKIQFSSVQCLQCIYWCNTYFTDDVRLSLWYRNRRDCKSPESVQQNLLLFVQL